MNVLSGIYPFSPSFVKCNCDAIVFYDMDETGLDSVLRDEHGHLLAYKMMKLLSFFVVK